MCVWYVCGSSSCVFWASSDCVFGVCVCSLGFCEISASVILMYECVEFACVYFVYVVWCDYCVCVLNV